MPHGFKKTDIFFLKDDFPENGEIRLFVINAFNFFSNQISCHIDQRIASGAAPRPNRCHFDWREHGGTMRTEWRNLQKSI